MYALWPRAVLHSEQRHRVGCLLGVRRGGVCVGVWAVVVRRMRAVRGWAVLDGVWCCGLDHMRCHGVRSGIVRVGAGHVVFRKLRPVWLRQLRVGVGRVICWRMLRVRGRDVLDSAGGGRVVQLSTV